jgi:hypothetical protein
MWLDKRLTPALPSPPPATVSRGGHLGSCIPGSPSMLAVGAAVASIVVKEFLYQVGHSH